jgi:hypothetical protein
MYSRIYKVADHLFEIEMDADASIWSMMEESYGPFEVHGSCSEILFRVEVCDIVDCNGAELIYSNKDTVEPGFISLDVFRDSSGYFFQFIQPGSQQVNASLYISNDYKNAKLSLSGTKILQWYAFNTSVNLCYMTACSCKDTVLAHASCVAYKGKAWLFLGKSGTGKSTHSRMWLNALEGVELMNDDHPVIRLNSVGQPIAYGSPWSGKTKCYRNVQAPIGGIIRIVRAPYNKARRLSPIESYASLMTSFSGLTWEKNLADGRDKTIQGIISSVPCWAMECLPEEDAARVCSRAVTQE